MVYTEVRYLSGERYMEYPFSNGPWGRIPLYKTFFYFVYLFIFFFLPHYTWKIAIVLLVMAWACQQNTDVLIYANSAPEVNWESCSSQSACVLLTSFLARCIIYKPRLEIMKRRFWLNDIWYNWRKTGKIDYNDRCTDICCSIF